MTTATNAEDLRQNRSLFSLIVEQTLAFASSTNLLREVNEANFEVGTTLSTEHPD